MRWEREAKVCIHRVDIHLRSRDYTLFFWEYIFRRIFFYQNLFILEYFFGEAFYVQSSYFTIIKDILLLVLVLVFLRIQFYNNKALNIIFYFIFEWKIQLVIWGKVYYPKKICLIQGKKITSTGEKKNYFFPCMRQIFPLYE